MVTPRRRRLLGVLALVCLGLQFGGSLLLSLLALGLWLTAMAVWERAVLRRLWLPRFWLITLVFALGSGLMLGPRDIEWAGLRLSRLGLESGLLMICRGVLLFGLVSWASKALLGPGWLRLARRLGAERLGLAVGTALRLLPELKDRLRSERRPGDPADRPGGAWSRAVALICETARLADGLGAAGPTPPRPRLLAIVGPPGSGKTAALGALVSRLRASGLCLGGVCQPRLDPPAQGYWLEAAAGGERRPFARPASGSAGSLLGFQFDPASWSWAAERIRAGRQTADVLVVDELGLLEAIGRGHAAALLERPPSERAAVWLLGVRAGCEAELQSRLGCFERAVTAPAALAALDELVDWVRQAHTAASGTVRGRSGYADDRVQADAVGPLDGRVAVADHLGRGL